MKKIIIPLTIILGSFFFNNTQAQVAVGVKGGINITNVTSYNGDGRVSGNAGLFLHAQLNSNWCIQPEILYSGQGVKYSTIDGERRLSLDYIQVPVMLQYFPVKQFYIEAGPQVGFLTNAEIRDNSGEKLGSANNSFNKTDVALNVGAGIRATKQLGFFARYNFGLTDITKNDNQTSRNEVGQVGMYVRLSH